MRGRLQLQAGNWPRLPALEQHEWTPASGTAEPMVQEVLARLRETVTAFNTGSGRPFDLRFSAGCIGYSQDRHAGVEALLAEADAQMYEQKQASRNTAG